jgi:hypothetical protein
MKAADGAAAGPGASGDGGRVPPFDPLRTVGAVQRQAIESAGRIIGEFLDLVERPPAPETQLDAAATHHHGNGSTPDGSADTTFRQARADLARAVDLYVDLFRRTFEAYADLTESALRRRAVTASGDGEGPAAPLVLRAGPDGVAEGKFWLHNTTDAAIPAGAVEVTALVAHGGAHIPAARASVDPPSLPAVPPGESATALVRVEGAGAPPGHYAGHLLTPHAALALHVEVPAAGDGQP